jgi:hypothetical protein
MTLSSKRARQEVVFLLREWRRYGIRGIQVDKQRNIVFGKLGAKNCRCRRPLFVMVKRRQRPNYFATDLNLKEVEFAVEIMTVIEHGKKQPLCIVRFTQERGAASSLHRIAGTMKIMFASQYMLVTDKHKRKMMINTLNS